MGRGWSSGFSGAAEAAAGRPSHWNASSGWDLGPRDIGYNYTVSAMNQAWNCDEAAPSGQFSFTPFGEERQWT